MKCVVVLLLAALLGCGDDSPPRCDDALRNGTETDVDCGGECFARCAVDQRCASDADCMFAACAAGVCAAPEDGPEPTGPVSRIIDPGGSTFEVVTDERVAIAFAFPPGAVNEPVAITLTPKRPQRGTWTNVEIELMPEGQLLEQPATITMRLPAGVTFDPASILAFGTEPNAFIAGGGQTGPELAVTTWLFGNPRRLARKSLPEDNTYWERMTLQASRMPLDVMIPILRALVNDLLGEGRPEDALGVLAVINVVLQRTGEPGFEATAVAALDEMAGIACDGVTSRLGALMTSDLPPPARLCTWQFDRDVKPAYGTVAVAQLLGDAAGQPCAAAMTLSEVAGREVQKIANFVKQTAVDESARVAWSACECSNPDVEKRPAGCPMISPVAMTLPADHWRIAVDVLERDQTIFNIVDAFATGHSQGLNGALTSANEAAFRAQAFAHCLDSRDMSPLGELAEIAPDRPALADDGQRCAVAVTAELADGNNTVVDSKATPAPVSGGGTPTLELGIARGHTVRVRGPVATLVCRDQGFAGDTRLESDELRITAVLGPTTVVVGTLAANGSPELLSGTMPFEIALDDLLQQLGVLSTDPLPLRIELRFERLGPHCADAYDSTSRELFRVVLTQVPILDLEFDETSGSIAADSSGNGRDATLAGGASFGTGHCRGALAVPGQGPHASIPADSAFDLTGEYTISAWINYTDNSNTGHWIATTQPNNSINTGWQLYLFDWGASGPTQLQFRIPESVGNCNYSAGNITSGQWHHIAVAGASGGAFTLYVDGTSVGTSPASCDLVPSGLPLLIGGGIPGCSSCGFDGLIDELRIYDRKLAASEISQLATASCP